MKSRLTSAEIQCEVMDIVNLRTSLPVEMAPKEINFCEKLKADQKVYKKLLGIPLSDFNGLLDEVTDAYKMTTMSGNTRKHMQSKDELLPLETVLIMTLFWLREYPSMTLLSSLFLLHPRTLIKFLQRMVSALAKVLRKEISWPSEEEWQVLLEKFNPLLPPSLLGCIAVVDGSEFKIQ